MSGRIYQPLRDAGRSCGTQGRYLLLVGLILGVGIPLRNKAIKKRRENMKEKGNEEK